MKTWRELYRAVSILEGCELGESERLEYSDTCNMYLIYLDCWVGCEKGVRETQSQCKHSIEGF